MTAAAPIGAVARFRLRLSAACAVLIGLAMLQSPGLLVADTKLDLAVAPGRFLLRAVHLWDPLGAFGQLQNQAYGYLWPMGPFFLGGDGLGVPDWVSQRLWMALVLCVALAGAAHLARELGVRSDLACIVAGFAYSLSPRMLSTLGQISIEAWPSALAPWVLLPLVIGSTRGSARRAAAWSALAVAMVGGVNAAATFAVLPLGVVWLLTRSRGRRRTAMMLWWPIFTLVATLWWLVPLFVLGAYSPPFLDYIESASNTTFPTTIYDGLRGTSNWVVYLGAYSRAGNDLLRDPVLIINGAVVVVLGLLGVLHRRNPERLFLALGVLTGMLLVTFGHTGSVQGWIAADAQAALDGVLAPLRNVHKFDPVVRLPLVLGLAWTIDRLMLRLRARPAASVADRTSRGLQRFNHATVLAAAVIAVGGAAIPAAVGRITPNGGFTAIPDYWSEAAEWLEARDAAALMLPGSSFGDYVWGFPQDEPMQPLARVPWALRNAVPLTPPGNIRMLDTIEERIAQGQGSAALGSYLRRAGVTHIVVRNDLARSPDVPDPVLVHQALAASSSVMRVASFGPEIGGSGHLESKEDARIVINGGWQASYPAIEVYAVVAPAGGDRAETSRTVPVVVGGAEDLLDLTELGVLQDEPTRLAVDVPTGKPLGSPLVLTDGLRAVERHFGRLHDGRSATLAPGDERRLANPTRDYLPRGAGSWVTWAEYQGIEGVRASSAQSDVVTSGVVDRGRLPFAALDGTDTTYWQAGQRGSGAWWEVHLKAPRAIHSVRVTAGPEDRELLRIRVGHRTTDPVSIPPGATRRIDLADVDVDVIRVEDASGRAGHLMSLAEVEIPGVHARRDLVLPSVPEAWGAPDRIVLRAVSDARTGCVTVGQTVRCVPGREVAAEEPLGFRRVIRLPATASYADMEIRTRGRAGPSLQTLLDEGQLATATASSAGNPDLRSSALAAIDGDIGTTWSASITDLNPTLDLRWIGERVISGLELRLLPDAAARLPNELLLTWPDGRRTVSVDADGDVRFPSIRTDRLTLTVREADPAVNLGFDKAISAVPVGISEVRVIGVPYFPRAISTDPMRMPCGSGPEVEIAGHTFRTSVTASARDLYVGATAPAHICGDVEVARLPAGASTVSTTASDLFTPVSLVLSDGVEWTADVRGADVTDRSPVERRIKPDTDRGLLTVHQNANPGWTATQAGTLLDPVVVDGWQQGWWLAGGDPVRARFEPDRTYRIGLAGGAFAVLALLAVTVVRWRPWRDTGERSLLPARLSALAAAPIALVVGGLLAGWPGAGVAALGVAAAALARRAPVTATAFVWAAMAPAAAAYALRPWGNAEGWAGSLAWPHYLVVFTLCLVLGVVAEPGRPRSRRSSAGRSTRR